MIQTSRLPVASGKAFGTTSADGSPNVIVNSVYPGSCVSNINRDKVDLNSFAGRWIIPMILRTAEQGARSVISGLCLGAESQGKYWWNDELAE